MADEIIIPFTLFTSIAVILWKFFDGRQKVRIAAIEKGSIDENIKYLFGSSYRQPSRLGALKWGLAAAFIGIAVLVSIPLQAFEWARSHQGELITGLVFTGGGLAFLIYYAVAEKAAAHEK